MVETKIRQIRRQLAAHRPAPDPRAATTWAAVALLLQPQQDDLHLLFIHRAHHPQDPWSGHMAFPGGRKDPDDPDLFVTIQRETQEEVGIDLKTHGEYLGRLAAVQAMARGRPIDMNVTPFVYLVSPEAQPAPDPIEVQDILWIPLAIMQQDDMESVVPRPLPDGGTITVPALVYGGKTIWGLTYRVLQNFLALIRQQ